MARPLAFAGVLVLAGCTVGPDFHPPVVKTPANWLNTDQTTSPAAESKASSAALTVVDWWSMFGDDTLTRLVHDAADQNLTLMQADARIRSARSAIAAIDAGLLPSVSATGSYSYGSGPTYIGDEPREAPPHTSWHSGLSAVWNLDIFGATRRAAEAATANLEVSVESRHDTLVTLLADVGIDYISLRSQQELLRIANLNLVDEQSTLKITQDRWQAGLASKLDYENAKSAADSTNAQIPSLQASINTQIYALALLLGRDPGALIKDLDTPAPLPKTPTQVPIGLPADLLRRRPDIRAAEAQIHADTATIGATISQYYPQFSLTGSFGFQGVSIGQMSQWASQVWSWGPSINWPIFEGGQISAQVEEAKATLQSDIFAYHNTVLTALNQVETSLVDFDADQQRSVALRAVVDDNQQAYNLSKDLYTQGTAEFINVLSAELSLASSENQLEQSEASVATDLVTLFKSLGGGWEQFPARDATQLDYAEPNSTAPTDTVDAPLTPLPAKTP
ncbi:MAG TPA: efflux transporter outer membrane subunit [Opitutales bacterium]|nr:efflux transporter outer membrane subunit [Opitutales bacterium]